MPGTLLLVAKAANAKEILSNQLREIFQDSILIMSRCLDELCQEDIEDASLVLFSNRAVLNEYKNTKNMPIQNSLVAERYIYLDNLNEIIALPQGEKALVVSNLRISAEDTINEINDVGINHLRLIPYYPGCGLDINGIDVAISPAAGDIVPTGIKKVINVGVRRIAISTIFKITNFFNLPIEIVDKYIMEYTREFMLQAEKLNRTIAVENRLNHELGAILNSVHDAIVATDADCNIIVFNPKAEELFGYKGTEVMGKNICKIIPQNNFRKIIELKKAITDTLEKIGNRFLISNKTPLFMDGTVTGIVATYQDVTEVQKLEQDVRGKLNERGYVAKFTFNDIIMNSNSMYKVVQKAKKFAMSNEPILLKGETGVGKEMFAQAVHNYSDRKNGPFVAVNFGALPETLAESELFGYEEGAFTGAKKGGKPGLFEQAHRGTIFLDEIGDAPPAIQIMILRVLQEKCVIRLGGTKIIPVNVRIIAATNRDLKELINYGKFREDLYYRLNVLSMSIPSLRERRQDIIPLAEYFLSRNGNNLMLSDCVKSVFYNYSWPGNVRELENVIRYLSAMYSDKDILVEDLPNDLINDTGNLNKEEEVYDKLPLFDEKFFNEYVFILKVIEDYNNKGKVCGRGSIQKEIKERFGVELSDEKIRWRLKNLSNKNYIEIGKTKQGCRITEKGEKILSNLVK